MKAQINRWLTPPVFENDEEKTWRANLLNTTTIVLTIAIIVVFIGNLIGGGIPPTVLVINVTVFFGILILRRLLFNGKVALTSLTIIVFGIILFTASVVSLGTTRTPTTAGFMLIIIISGFLFGKKGLVFTAISSSLTVLGLILAENAGMLPHPDYTVNITQWITYTVFFGLSGALTYYSYQSTYRSLKRAFKESADRKRAEEVLRESEEKFRILFHSGNDAVFVYHIYEDNLFGKFIEVNDVACKRLGYNREELLNMSPLDISTPEAIERSKSMLKKFSSEGKPLFEWIHKTKEGREIPVEISSHLFDFKGKPTVISIARDTTERKKAEEVLAGAANEWEETFDAVDDMIAIIDDERNIIRANKAMKEAFGKRNIGEMKCYELFHGTDEPIPLCPSTKSFETGEFEHLELEEPHLDNRVFDVFTYPIKVEEGSTKKVVHVARDITERKKAEDKLKRYADDLERTNEDVKNFSYIVSHDLKAPLINIKGYNERIHLAFEEITQLLTPLLNQLDKSEREKFSNLVDKDVPKYMEFINLSTNRIRAFSNAILELSRLGRKELAFSTIDMNKVVSSSLHNLAHKIEEKGITIDVMELYEIVADWNSIQTIIDNLVSNAVNYLDPERVGKIEIKAVEGKDETTFYIKDNGMGISEKDRERIFNIFQRSGKQDIPGEGMGLAYVKTLVERHNGRIWCESELGVGSTFVFTISKHLGSRKANK